MPIAVRSNFISVEDYLAGEAASEIKHEYIHGTVYAMAGASEEHNTITVNLLSALHNHLRGKTCRVFMADLKVRPRLAEADIFYYPDIMVTCDPRDTHRYFKCFPIILIEVLSPETERIDRSEKFFSYTQIETLEDYVLVAQHKREVTVFRRSSHWQPEILCEPEQELRLSSLHFNLSLSRIYEGISLDSLFRNLLNRHGSGGDLLCRHRW